MGATPLVVLELELADDDLEEEAAPERPVEEVDEEEADEVELLPDEPVVEELGAAPSFPLAAFCTVELNCPLMLLSSKRALKAMGGLPSDPSLVPSMRIKYDLELAPIEGSTFQEPLVCVTGRLLPSCWSLYWTFCEPTARKTLTPPQSEIFGDLPSSFHTTESFLPPLPLVELGRVFSLTGQHTDKGRGVGSTEKTRQGALT